MNSDKNQIKRFGVSMEEDLLNDLDALVEEKHFPNRSQAIRYLIKNRMVEDSWEENREVAGAIVLIFDHHQRDLHNKSTQVQHKSHDLIMSVMHVHLDHDNCMETIAVRGKARELRDLANHLIGLKGVKHGKLVMSAPE